MKIGLFAPLANPFATPDYLRTLGAAAEERGFDSIWVAEHVVLFDDYGSQYPYAENGKIPVPEESGLLDPFVALGFLAAATTRIRLGTGICLVPQRNPVYTAKEVATADWLSGGRLDFGVGVGWLAEEFAALDVPFERRGERTRAYIKVMQRLWSDAVSAYDDEFYRLPPSRQFPKPLQQPHPPIHFGGESDAALRRTADLGQGWYGFSLDPEQAGERVRRLEAMLRKRSRQRADVLVSICPYMRQGDIDMIHRYGDAGVDQVIVTGAGRDEASLIATLDRLAHAIVEPARAM